MRQCRQHGTRLEDGTRVGHHWLITEVLLSGRRYQRGVCKHCGRKRSFATKPKPRIVETYDRMLGEWEVIT